MYRNARKGFAVFSWQRNVVTLQVCNLSSGSKLTKVKPISPSCKFFEGSGLLKQKTLRCLSVGQSNCIHFNSNKSGHWMTDKMNKLSDGKKPQLRIVRIREKRQKHGRAKALNERTPPTSLQIIGDGTKGSPASVMLIAGNNRMLFNSGEGIQRLLLENGIKSMSRVEHVLFTRLTWNNIGGAVGMAIGLKTIGLPKINFHGPRNLKKFVDAFQIFAKKDSLDIVTRPYTMGDIETDVLHITPVPLFSSTATPNEISASLASASRSSESSQSSSDSEAERGTDKRKATFNKHNAVKKRKTIKTAEVSVAYVCKLYNKPGKLRMDKIKALGVNPRGPHLLQLKLGNSYTMEDGTVIKPEDCVGLSEPAIYFIVLECPSEDFIEAVTTSDIFARHQDGNGSDVAKIVIHMCPQNVVDNAVYRAWMHKFGTTTEHVVLNETNSSKSHLAVRRMQTKLNLLHDTIFPTLPFPTVSDDKEECATEPQSADSLRILHADSYMQFHLRPNDGWSSEHAQSASTEPFLQEVKDLPSEFETSLENMKTSIETLGGSHSNKYPEIVFTGTGSAMPNKARNVTGIVVNISDTQSIILDCGDGTYGQLYRFYGKQHIDDIIARIQCIFVSHIHADHHSGLVHIVQEWNRIMEERNTKSRKLILVGPITMNAWLNKYDADCESILDKTRFVDLRSLSAVAVLKSSYEEELMQSLDLLKFETVPVLHCSNSHAVVLTHKSGWKLAYSGDCMPSDRLVKAGQNADLLIHEATLEDGMGEDAVFKRHSMVSQAINIGTRMKAKFTLLTHFSQRYMKIPVIKSELSDQVGIAFDNMRVSLSELPILPKFLPVLHQLFADDIEEMEKKRSRKEEKAFLFGDNTKEMETKQSTKEEKAILNSDDVSSAQTSETSIQDEMGR